MASSQSPKSGSIATSRNCTLLKQERELKSHCKLISSGVIILLCVNFMSFMRDLSEITTNIVKLSARLPLMHSNRRPEYLSPPPPCSSAHYGLPAALMQLLRRRGWQGTQICSTPSQTMPSSFVTGACCPRTLLSTRWPRWICYQILICFLSYYTDNSFFSLLDTLVTKMNMKNLLIFKSIDFDISPKKSWFFFMVHNFFASQKEFYKEYHLLSFEFFQTIIHVSILVRQHLA